jgi:hypothetical protein
LGFFFVYCFGCFFFPCVLKIPYSRSDPSYHIAVFGGCAGVLTICPHPSHADTALPPTTMAGYTQILAYADEVYARLPLLGSPIEMDASHIVAPSPMLYPLLDGMPLKELRLKFEILRYD